MLKTRNVAAQFLIALLILLTAFIVDRKLDVPFASRLAFLIVIILGALRLYRSVNPVITDWRYRFATLVALVMAVLAIAFAFFEFAATLPR